MSELNREKLIEEMLGAAESVFKEQAINAGLGMVKNTVNTALGFREGYKQIHRDIVADEKDLISAKLSEWADGVEVELILTTGGTGLGPRDVTPEATRAVIDIEVPGIAEAMRIETLKNTPFAMLSRSVAGVRSGCLIINLPGSPKAVRETLEVAVPAIPHALEMIKGWRTHPGG